MRKEIVALVSFYITNHIMHISNQRIHNMGDRKDVIVMCGISGMVGLDEDETVVRSMLKTMDRRGPDSNGIYQDTDATLLHSRLAIIDPLGGKQPMRLSNSGESYVIVYNGEVYNTQEIRKKLVRLGHSFFGYSDTEIVLHAYAEFGSDCLQYLNGIFAFAVWEEKNRRLFLARDRMGVKPLFYSLQDNGLVFASEIKTILAYPSVKAKLDETGARQLLLLGPGRLPGSGVFKDILELEPGWCGYYENRKLQLKQYWKLRDREHHQSFADTSAVVKELVTDSIRRQMISDVPVGTFLSGGLDSSIITAVCALEQKEKGETLQTFSVDYLDNDFYFQPNAFQPNSDNAYIALMQKEFSTDHYWSVLRPEALFQALEEATIARDLPGMGDVDFSLLLFAGEIRKHVKVALSGECADELFGGYPWFRDPKILRQSGFPWAQNTQLRAIFLHHALQTGAEEFVMDAYQTTCRESDILPGTSVQERRIKEMVNLNVRWFMQTLLDRKDRMSMYHGLEVRVPFCDYRIAEYLYSVPWEMKEYQGREKGLLRHAMEGLLPEQILNRKKSPYPKTFDPVYEKIVSEHFRELLKKDTPLWHLIRKEEAEKLTDQEFTWPWYGQLMGRPQTIAYFLQLDFWLNYYQIEFCF